MAPWNTVIEYWKKTFNFRYNSLSDKEKHYSFFSDLPAIKGPIGFTLVSIGQFLIRHFKSLISLLILWMYNNYNILINCYSLQIELDFEQLYPEKDLILFTNFELFKTKTPNLIRKNKYKGIDSLVDEILTPTVLGKLKFKNLNNFFGVGIK